MNVPQLDKEARLLLQSSALEAAANSVLITDLAATILWVNPAFSALTGYSPEEVIGRNPRLLKSGQHNAEFYESLWSTLSSGQIWRGEFINRRKDGSLCVSEQTIAPVRTRGKEVTHYIGVMQDITRRKEAEEALRELNAELEERVGDRTRQIEEANKELEAFAYSVSHDLRAPLRHIRGFIELLSESVRQNLSGEDLHFFRQIDDSAKAMGGLIDKLLDFSRMSRVELHREALRLESLVEAAIRQLEPETNGRRIIWNKRPLPTVHADPALLGFVFNNLLSNAVKYSRPRNPATIDIGCASDSAAETVIYVCDNGVGFDMKFADKLFGVFQRLHGPEQFEGTGIGLANVRRIIARHGGRTWAESKLDAGATFYFSLPKNQSSPG
jgi:PAS domain S-box-containing protein